MEGKFNELTIEIIKKCVVDDKITIGNRYKYLVENKEKKEEINDTIEFILKILCKKLNKKLKLEYAGKDKKINRKILKLTSELVLNSCLNINLIDDTMRMKNLCVLNVYYCNNIKNIENIKTLKELDVQECKNLENIRNLQSLEKLKIRKCNKLKSINNMQSIKRLEIKDNEKIKEIIKLRNLKELLTESFVSGIHLLKNLEILEINNIDEI